MNIENKLSYTNNERKCKVGNQLYNDFEKTRISTEIEKRKNIISDYYHTAVLDRERAKNLINTLKETDVDVKAASYLKEMQFGTIDLNIAPNDTLIFNLQIQLDVLEAKLAKIALEEIK